MGKLRPLDDRIVVKPIEPERVTASGLILPQSTEEAQHHGEVVGVGPGPMVDGQRVPIEIEVGDEVIYSKFAGAEVTLDDIAYRVLRIRDVYAVLEE